MCELFILSNGLWISPENVSADTQDARVVAQTSSLGANSINKVIKVFFSFFWIPASHHIIGLKHYDNSSSSIVFTVKSIHVDQNRQPRLAEF